MLVSRVFVVTSSISSVLAGFSRVLWNCGCFCGFVSGFISSVLDRFLDSRMFWVVFRPFQC